MEEEKKIKEKNVEKSEQCEEKKWRDMKEKLKKIK